MSLIWHFIDLSKREFGNNVKTFSTIGGTSLSELPGPGIGPGRAIMNMNLGIDAFRYRMKKFGFL